MPSATRSRSAASGSSRHSRMRRVPAARIRSTLRGSSGSNTTDERPFAPGSKPLAFSTRARFRRIFTFYHSAPRTPEYSCSQQRAEPRGGEHDDPGWGAQRGDRNEGGEGDRDPRPAGAERDQDRIVEDRAEQPDDAGVRAAHGAGGARRAGDAVPYRCDRKDQRERREEDPVSYT